MSEREDVEALAERLFVRLGWSGCAGASWDLTQGACRQKWYDMAEALLPELAARDEAVRVSERVRLAGEVEALADRFMAFYDPRNPIASEHAVAAMRTALVPVPGVRLTEEE